MAVPVRNWLDLMNWPPSPLLGGNITVQRTVLGPPVQTETFESYVAGALAGQGQWKPLVGGANPAINVDASSLIDGANSATWSLGGANTAAGAAPFVFPSPIDLAAGGGRVTVRCRCAAAATDADPFNHMPWFSFNAHTTTGVFPYQTGIGNQYLGLYVLHYDVGLGAVQLMIIDDGNPTGGGYNLAIAADTVFELTFVMTGGVNYSILLNGNPSGIPPSTFFANGNMTGYELGHHGIAPGGIIALDSFRFSSTVAVAETQGTNLLFNGEVSDPLRVGSGWDALTIQAKGAAFNAGSSVLVEHSPDGVAWFTLFTINGNAAGSDIGVAGTLTTSFLRFTATLPTDTLYQGVAIIVTDR